MSTTIVVLADTHVADENALPVRLLEDMERADLVVHLGDFTGVDLYRRLRGRYPLVAVRGNGDSHNELLQLPLRADFAVGDHRLTAIHGHVGGKTAHQSAAAIGDADVVLFGHSHLPASERLGGRLLFNPGSPTRRRFVPFCSYGILKVGQQVGASIVRLD